MPLSDDEILQRMTEILRDLLDDPSINLSAATARTDVPNFDSFAYVNFIVAIEMEFGVKFQIADIESFSTAGDIEKKIREILG